MLDCFEPTWDKRWENSFQTAFGAFSMEKVAWIPYTKNIVTLTSDLCQKYGIDASHVGEKIYPYVDCDGKTMSHGGNQYTASVWPKGVTTGDISTLMTPKKVYVIDYPLPAMIIVSSSIYPKNLCRRKTRKTVFMHV